MRSVAIILAAGKGVRMRSDLPKVSHMILGKPMISWVVEAVSKLGLDDIYIVVGYKSDIVKEECRGSNVKFVEQTQQLGTGHAVMQAAPFINNSVVLVLNGDMPLIKADTLRAFLSWHRENPSASATVLTTVLEDAGSYGRMIRSADDKVAKIVEKKDATKAELEIKEINTGTYCFNSKDLFDALEKVKPDNAQKEYYLTDVIGILRAQGKQVYAYKAKDPNEVLGVNTIEELKRLEELHGHGK